MSETLQYTTELSPEEEQDRLDIIKDAIGGRTINLCTDKPANFGDPRVALELAGSPANID